jgi:ABC-type sulfate transport system substrate-binding protein
MWDFCAELVRTAENHPIRWWTAVVLSLVLVVIRSRKRGGKRRFKFLISYDSEAGEQR